ncbi:MAG: beta-N-acetylhexosaminidase [Alphaproteobacteria bacterium]
MIFEQDSFNQLEGMYILNMEDNNIMPSIEDQIGSMLIIGFNGTDFNTSTGQGFLTKIENKHVGSVILFKYNIKSSDQLKELTQTIHDANPACTIYIDQEGGKVQRLRFNEYPSAAYIAKNYTVEEAEEIYSDLAAELKEFGVDANFGPLVDLNNIKAPCQVIGGLDRSYSEDPDIVVDYASAFIEAHHKNSILTCIKHFPGHGYAQGDTHHGLVDVTETYNEIELLPFYKLIDQNKVDMIMTAHILNKNFDPNYPATLSKITLDKLLRNNGYDGVIVSDDLLMSALSENYEFEDLVIQSINAGCDMLIISNNAEACKHLPDYEPDNNIAIKIIDIVKKAIEKQVITEEQINNSYRRIVELKSKFKL